MKTESIQLTEYWKKISDGKLIHDVEVTFGVALFCFSTSRPSDNNAAHTRNIKEFAKIGPPLIAWFRTDFPGSEITVSSYALET